MAEADINIISDNDKKLTRAEKRKKLAEYKYFQELMNK